jgi:hypothetical protein
MTSNLYKRNHQTATQEQRLVVHIHPSPSSLVTKLVANMPNMQAISDAVAELPKGPPLVTALAGGTTGIGAYIAKALATAFAKEGSKLRVYIVGRNAERAEAVISEAKKISPGSEWRFVKATDLALISEVDRCCADIVRQETESPFHGGLVRLDLLYMTHCYPILKERSSRSTWKLQSRQPTIPE